MKQSRSGKDIRRALKSLFLIFFVAQIFVILQVQAIQKQDLSKLKILSANELVYKDKITVLKGDVKVEYDGYVISSPEAELDKGRYVKFSDKVKVISSNIEMYADELDIDLKASLLLSKNTQTTWKDHEEEYKVQSYYQSLNFDSGIAKAYNKSTRKGFKASKIEKVYVETKDFLLSSEEMFLYLNKSGSNKQSIKEIRFKGNIHAFQNSSENKESKSELKADYLHIFPQYNLFKARGNVTMLSFDDENQRQELDADFVVIERYDNEDVITAQSNSPTEDVMVFSEARDLKGYGKIIQAWLPRTKNGQSLNPEQIVFSKDAKLQLEEKLLYGDEIVIRPNEAEMIKSIVGRPRVALLKQPAK